MHILGGVLRAARLSAEAGWPHGSDILATG